MYLMNSAMPKPVQKEIKLPYGYVVRQFAKQIEDGMERGDRALRRGGQVALAKEIAHEQAQYLPSANLD